MQNQRGMSQTGGAGNGSDSHPADILLCHDALMSGAQVSGVLFDPTDVRRKGYAAHSTVMKTPLNVAQQASSRPEIEGNVCRLNEPPGTVNHDISVRPKTNEGL